MLSPTGCLDEDTVIDVLVNNINKKITLKELEYLINVEKINNVKIDSPTGYGNITDTYRKN